MLFFVKYLMEKSSDAQLYAHAYFLIAEEHAYVFTGMYRFHFPLIYVVGILHNRIAARLGF
jgi:hypothetical protein